MLTGFLRVVLVSSTSFLGVDVQRYTFFMLVCAGECRVDTQQLLHVFEHYKLEGLILVEVSIAMHALPLQLHMQESIYQALTFFWHSC
jgi:hypothetical protein